MKTNREKRYEYRLAIGFFVVSALSLLDMFLAMYARSDIAMSAVMAGVFAGLGVIFLTRSRSSFQAGEPEVLSITDAANVTPVNTKIASCTRNGRDGTTDDRSS
jgi:hypothetical protein